MRNECLKKVPHNKKDLVMVLKKSARGKPVNRLPGKRVVEK